MEYKDLDVWKKSRFLAKSIIEVAELLPSKENFAMGFQIRKSAISIPSNIAEGSGRTSNKEFLHFLNISLSSSFELETQLILSNDLFNLQTEDLILKIHELQKMTVGFKKIIADTISVKDKNESRLN